MYIFNVAKYLKMFIISSNIINFIIVHGSNMDRIPWKKILMVILL